MKEAPSSVPLKPPYGEIKKAYGHLLKDDSYQPYEHRDDDDWVVVLFTETMVVRLFKSLEDVGRMYEWCIYRFNVYVKAEQLSAKHTGVKLGAMCEKVGLDVKGKPPLVMARMLWDYCQEKGDKVVTAIQSSTDKAVQDQYVYTVRIDLLKDPKIQQLVTKLPNQAQIIATALCEEEKTSYTEEELDRFAKQLFISQKLKTRQEPFRVVRYYCPALSDIGVMSYTARRKKEEAGR